MNTFKSLLVLILVTFCGLIPSVAGAYDNSAYGGVNCTSYTPAFFDDFVYSLGRIGNSAAVSRKALCPVDRDQALYRLYKVATIVDDEHPTYNLSITVYAVNEYTMEYVATYGYSSGQGMQEVIIYPAQPPDPVWSDMVYYFTISIPAYYNGQNSWLHNYEVVEQTE